MLAHQQQELLKQMSHLMRQRGFSLVELMVALAILGLLVMAAMPGLGTWLTNTRIRNAGDSLMNGLQTARAEAIRRNQNVSFWLVNLPNPATLSNSCTLSSTDGSWIVSVGNPVNYCAADVTSTDITVNPAGVMAGRAMGGDSTRVSVNAKAGGSAGTSVTFNGFGRVANTTSITEIDLDGVDGGATYRKLSVMVSSMGAVRMCDPAVTSTTDPRKC
jgi:type IV fimbrial biogenesis protein FimT